MRYAAAALGEYATALGEFSSGAFGGAVNVVVWNLQTKAVEPVTVSGCDELGSTGLYVWSTSGLTTQPTSYTELVYIMTAVSGERTHKGKLVIGGYPSDSALARFGGFVHIDVANGTSGNAFPLGTPGNEVNNVVDARAIADRWNIPAYMVRGGITLTTDHENWTFEGLEPTDDYVVVSPGVAVSGCQFAKAGVRGSLDGAITCQECLVGEFSVVTSGLRGIFNTCGVQGTLQLAGPFQGLDIASQALFAPGTVFDLSVAGAGLTLLGHATGIFSIANLTAGQAVGISLAGGELTLQATCTGGWAFLYGYGEVGDASDGTTVGDYVLKGSELQALGPALAAVAADVERLYGRNARTRLWYADVAVVSGQGGATRNVPVDAASHMEAQVKTDLQADWSSPTTFYVAFGYAVAATATTPPASAEPADVAPSDGTFSAEPYP